MQDNRSRDEARWPLLARVVLAAYAVAVAPNGFLPANIGTLRDELKNGGAILARPGTFMVGVALPEVASFTARLGIVAASNDTGETFLPASVNDSRSPG